MNLYVQACVEKNWQEDIKVKKTDVHYGSKLGHGEYNYRLVFPVKLPGEPRLKLSLMDNNKIGSDTSVGTAIINIGRMYKKIKTQGRYTIDDVLIHFKDPNS